MMVFRSVDALGNTQSFLRIMTLSRIVSQTASHFRLHLFFGKCHELMNWQNIGQFCYIKLKMEHLIFFRALGFLCSQQS
jgi:hypothetical protein